MKERFKEKYVGLCVKTMMPFTSALMALSEASDETYREASESGDKMGMVKALFGSVSCGVMEGVAACGMILVTVNIGKRFTAKK